MSPLNSHHIERAAALAAAALCRARQHAARQRAVAGRFARFITLLCITLFLAPARASETALAPWTGGAPAPFALDVLHGGRVELADFRGRVILVHFFATWCEPCRAVTKAWKIDVLPTTIVLDPALTPLLVAAGDLDWDRPDIRRAVEAHLPAPTAN
jgi:thiol-disulfide isomerase/thioredoxin